ncbi:nitrate reductase molybdenum cofactor assembly chaperone [Asticcacaulis sp. BYS171W]|uniref:Nitrate reductase molybdenum cofactor assembly chaperone n=1 Tax=Asticcacaulis aquaticus TaxID=2984212 RepID=A0ABT5HWZ1_9CAUL|nr:nitrate reductase molybdenum cofactor assembly chaperone [Asticcacaulis aquaticus]MDC7684442.1 nitrate reductase molybdenum cofactor assembly chaperone [Asticcacaulis aquaticus]
MSAEHQKALTFKALGLMLCYPTPEWTDNLPELLTVIQAEGLLGPAQIDGVNALADHLRSDVIAAQESYVATFDRVRSLSLHLFEHVHGESRDRGQAMIDLIDRYREVDLIPPTNELPDYLPMFLEYLSNLDIREAKEALSEPVHIIEAVAKRLQDRESPYLAVFNALLHLLGKPALRKAHVIIGGQKTADPTLEDIDKEWAEMPVEFLGATAPDTAQPHARCGS